MQHLPDKIKPNPQRVVLRSYAGAFYEDDFKPATTWAAILQGLDNDHHLIYRDGDTVCVVATGLDVSPWGHA